MFGFVHVIHLTRAKWVDFKEFFILFYCFFFLNWTLRFSINYFIYLLSKKIYLVSLEVGFCPLPTYPLVMSHFYWCLPIWIRLYIHYGVWACEKLILREKRGHNVPSKVNLFGQHNGPENGGDYHAERAEGGHEHRTPNLVDNPLQIICNSRANHPLTSSSWGS